MSFIVSGDFSRAAFSPPFFARSLSRRNRRQAPKNSPRRVNREREWTILQPLKWDPSLAAAARIHLHE